MADCPYISPVFARLSRSTGYKCSDLSSLVEGSTLIIGSKEIEVCNVTICDNTEAVVHLVWVTWFSMSTGLVDIDLLGL